MCNCCGNPNTLIDYVIDNGVTKDVVVCPNCALVNSLDANFKFDKGVYISEISASSGAIKIVPCGLSAEPEKEFVVTPDEASRLFRTALSAEEYKKLIENGHDPEEYLLHSDFYTRDGQSLQARDCH